MICIINENIYNMTLISKIKKQTGSKNTKKIIKYLRNLADDDVKKFFKLKIKIFNEKKEETKNKVSNVDASIIGPHRYVENFNESKLKPVMNTEDEHEGENTSASIDNNEEERKQNNDSNFSADE